MLCNILENVAKTVWNELSATYSSSRRKLDERSITQILVVNRIQDELNRYLNHQIILQESSNENENGLDIEIYYEVSKDQYVRLLLQAKKLYRSGYYEGLGHKVRGRLQFDILNSYAALTNCPSYYLFYNGVPNFTFASADCKGHFNENQLGCLMMRTDELNKVIGYSGINKVSFAHLIKNCTNNIVPWRVLGCCNMSRFLQSANYKTYSKYDLNWDHSFPNLIDGSDRSYSNLTGGVNGISKDFVERDKLGLSASNRIIICNFTRLIEFRKL